MTQNNSAFVLPADASLGGVISVFGQTITEPITAESSGGAYQVIDELTRPAWACRRTNTALKTRWCLFVRGCSTFTLTAKSPKQALVPS